MPNFLRHIMEPTAAANKYPQNSLYLARSKKAWHVCRKLQNSQLSSLPCNIDCSYLKTSRLWHFWSFLWQFQWGLTIKTWHHSKYSSCSKGLFYSLFLFKNHKFWHKNSLPLQLNNKWCLCTKIWYIFIRFCSIFVIMLKFGTNSSLFSAILQIHNKTLSKVNKWY